MNLNTVFTINVVIAGLFGLGFVFAPEAMQAPYGVSPEQAAASASMGRFFGASNLGYAMLFWFMRGTAASDAKSNFSIVAINWLSHPSRRRDPSPRWFSKLFELFSQP
jgi:hypothetical protein